MSSSPLLIAIISAGSALAGVAMKMLFDGLLERGKRRREQRSLFLPERKEVFDAFLECYRRNVSYRDRLHELTLRAVRGETEVPDSVIETFPDSPMLELVQRLGDLRRLARTYAVIEAAESMVRLFADMSAAAHKALDSPHDGNNELLRFLLCRFLEDREREYIHAYRRELGLDTPEGAPLTFMQHVHPQLDLAEKLVRTHLPRKRRGQKSETEPRVSD